MGDRPLLKWLELSVSDRWEKTGATMALHPVNLGEGQQCFAMTLGERWLCGSSGAVTFFNSRTAATRFLDLLNVSGFTEGECSGWDDSRHDPCQCFNLGSTGLEICGHCRIGRESQAQAIREFARLDDRW